MLYELDQVVYRYHVKTVLELEQLRFEQGKIHALVGHNGAGKTSLLMILAFLAQPTSGSMLFCGKKVENSEKARQQLRQDVVLVSQHPIMFSTTVSANIEFGLKVRKIQRAQRDRLVDEVLEMVGLEKYKYALAHELSGGETQRVALARALALSPKVLLCDEPTASVDMANQRVIVELLRSANSERGTSIIFATHDSSQSLSLAHQIIRLENGRYVDAPSQVAPCLSHSTI